ncbi:MAG: GNAT family N-acetyltransferase [Rikenellaceae bacterium]|nr:GNAT family N-acetyltransferase [Rikenellaceae bacterium]
MPDFTIKRADASVYDDLAELWERSVMATHHFVSEEDIVFFRSVVRDGFAALDTRYLECDGHPAAFMAIGGDKVEMLFVDPAYFGLGAGSLLMRIAVEAGARYVDVNEQNHGARAFYEHLGFETVSRDETDDSGREYPVLHMALGDGLRQAGEI